jgi:hypothetical protein
MVIMIDDIIFLSWRFYVNLITLLLVLKDNIIILMVSW